VTNSDGTAIRRNRRGEGLPEKIGGRRSFPFDRIEIAR